MTTDLKPGPELDAAVAEEVMGWKRGLDQSGSSYNCYFITGGNVWANPLSRLWSPSTDIAAAWLVVEKLFNSGLEVSVNLTHDKYFRIECHILTDDFRDGDHPAGNQWFVSADTAPLAICLAALEAVREK